MGLTLSLALPLTLALALTLSMILTPALSSQAPLLESADDSKVHFDVNDGGGSVKE